MNVITSIVAKLGLNTLEWEAGSRKAQKEMRDLEKSMQQFGQKTKYVALGVAGVATAVAAWADEIKDTASAADMTVNSVMKVGTALSQAGGEAKNSGRMISEFVKTIGEAADGSKTAQETFKKVGIGLNELRTMDNEQLFAKTVQNLADIPDAATRSARAFEMFGKAARGVDFAAFNEEFKLAKNLTKDQKAGIDDAAAAVDMFSLAIKKLYVVGAEYLGPMAMGFTQFLLDAVDALEKVVHGIEAMIKGIGNLVNAIPRLPASEAGDEYDSALTGAIDTATGGVVRTKKARAHSTGEDKITGLMGGKRSVTPAKETNKELNDLLSIYKVSDELAAKYKNTIGNINEKMAEMTMLTQEQVEVARTLNDIENQRVDTVGKLEVKYKEAVDKKASQTVLDAIQKEIDEVNRLAEAYSTAAQAAKMAEYQKRMSSETGWAEASRKYQEISINTAQAVTSSVDSFFNNMTSAMENFVQTGKFSFKDFANSVIQDILKIQMRMAMAGLISKAISFGMSAMAPTPGLTDNPAYMGPPTAAVAGMRAGGGDVTAGNAYIVGEKGPELFYPQSDGAIQPNNPMARGGTTVVQNFNITAIDPSSFNEKVLGVIGSNAKTVFSTVKEGERQMGSVSFA